MADLKLTPQEKNIVNYHRNTIKSGNVGIDEDGRPVTVYTTTIYIPSGPNAGKYVNVPGYVGGKIIKSEDELYRVWKRDIDTNKWPVFNTGEQGGKRAAEVHKIMDDEEEQAKKAMALQRNQNRVLLRDVDLQERR